MECDCILELTHSLGFYLLTDPQWFLQRFNSHAPSLSLITSSLDILKLTSDLAIQPIIVV